MASPATASAKPAIPAKPTAPVKRAVLAGSNYITEEYPPQGDRLSGCVNDVLLIRDTLIKRYKFDPANIQLLIDEGNDGKLKQPTAHNIVVALRTAMKASKPGDTLYFHFSGHGSTTKDTNSDEMDHQDEFIVASDFSPLVDDFLRGQIATLPDGVKFIFVCDACHSGSMLDQPTTDIQLTGDKGPAVKSTAAPEAKAGKMCHAQHSRQIAPAQYLKIIESHFKTPAEYLASLPYLPPERIPKADANLTWDGAVKIAVNAMKALDAKGKATKKLASPIVVKDKYVVLLSGCQDDQTSADAQFPINAKDFKAYGALTYCMVDTINSKPGAVTYYDLAKRTRDLLMDYGFDQNPTLSCPKELTTKAFIDG